MNFIDLQDFGTTTESHHQSTASLSQAAQICYIIFQGYQPYRISLFLLYYLPEISAIQNFLVIIDNDEISLCEK